MRILPGVSELTEPFWRAAREHRLVIQSCASCGHLQHPPEPGCSRCQGDELVWAETSGTGVLYSYTVAHHSVHPATVESVPYVIGLVELTEGPRLVANVRNCDASQLVVGMPLRVLFEDLTSELALVQFEPHIDRTYVSTVDQ